MVVSGDQNGLRVMKADSRTGYTWNTVATLSEPGFSTDLWVGNLCLTDPAHAVVVYGPRSFTNEQQFMERGGFTAVVDLDSGKVTKLPVTASLAYFDPTCNTTTRTAVLTEINDDAGRTRLVTINANGAIVTQQVVGGEVTSAVPTATGTVAARDGKLIRINRAGAVRTLASTIGSAFSLRVNGAGDVIFAEQNSKTERIRMLTASGVKTLATAAPSQLGLQSGASGMVFLTGTAKITTSLPAGVIRLDVPAAAKVSTTGGLAIEHVASAGMASHVAAGMAAAALDGTAPIQIEAVVPATERSLSFAVPPGRSGAGAASSPALSVGAHRSSSRIAPDASVGSPANETWDLDRSCSIPRNDPAEQAYQPTPNQVVWAVDMAIRGDLRSNYVAQGGWRGADGLGTVDPQGMFPLPTLLGGGRIPAQILLGVLTQESNLWQAEGGALPGQTGNPINPNWYGNPAFDPTNPEQIWQINWSASDCGYGIGQVTDGMRIGQATLSYAQQKAVALDYTSNIAEAAVILAGKWNELQSLVPPLTINNNSASKMEDWFAALWDYNSGFNYPGADSTNPTAWGLGWLNNPANPIYPPTRHAFLDGNTFSDAAQPQNWPYEEKVEGWAAWSIDTGRSYDDTGTLQTSSDPGYSTAGFVPAWWDTSADRSTVKPPLATFCQTAVNSCDVTSPPPCETQHILGCDSHHWWTQSATWKSDCATSCGHESLTYVTLRTEPGDGRTSTPDCSTSTLPSNALIIDSVSGAVPPMVDGCTRSWTNAGTLNFTFDPDNAKPTPRYEAKEDLHQIGGGFGGHFWYAHSRSSATDAFTTSSDPLVPGLVSGNMAINGFWQLNSPIKGWTRVFVHTSDTGSRTQQAVYTVHLGNHVESRAVNMNWHANKWIPIGVFNFDGTSAEGVSLSNFTFDGTADDDIAWGSVAFQPLPAKPKDFVVSFGDSFSSGEGAANTDSDYDANTDFVDSGPNNVANACHRSQHAWSRQAILPGNSSPTGDLEKSNDPSLDYHLIACSGAQTPNMWNTGLYTAKYNDYGELPQLQQGYLDANTTLVTLSIGGNDARFGPVVTSCLKSFSVTNSSCADNTYQEPGDGDPAYMNAAYSGQKFSVALPGIIHDIIVPRVVEVLDQIHGLAPNARIVLMGYPKLFENNGSCVQLSVLGLATIGLTASSAQFLNEDLATELNTSLSGAVAQANGNGDHVVFSDPTAQFTGKGACGNPEDIHGINTNPMITDKLKAPSWAGPLAGYGISISQSFHPKIEGNFLYALQLEDTLNSM